MYPLLTVKIVNYLLNICSVYVKLSPAIKYVAIKVKIIDCSNPQSIIICVSIKQTLNNE